MDETVDLDALALATQKPKAKRAKNGQQMNDAPSPYQVKTINSTDFHFSSVQPNDECSMRAATASF